MTTASATIQCSDAVRDIWLRLITDAIDERTAADELIAASASSPYRVATIVRRLVGHLHDGNRHLEWVAFQELEAELRDPATVEPAVARLLHDPRTGRRITRYTTPRTRPA